MVDIPDRILEEYGFHRLYSLDFEMARQACELLSGQTSDELRFTILRDVIVSYSRPFSGNRGKLVRHHRLPDDMVPQGMAALHAELIALRDQAFAHTDHEFIKPQHARWPRADGSAQYPMSFRVPPYQTMVARIDEIRALTVAMEELVNATIGDYQRSFDTLHHEQEAADQAVQGNAQGA
jgi:hypothetical protein